MRPSLPYSVTVLPASAVPLKVGVVSLVMPSPLCAPVSEAVSSTGSEGASGAPLLQGAAAVFECANRSQYVEGDHTIFVGEVLHCTHQGGSSPLLYHGGMFYTEHPLGQISPQALRPAHK